QTFREKLLLDFDHTVDQLYRNIDALIVALRVMERKRQELLVFDVVNAIARLLLHEYNNVILGEAKVAPLNDAANVLENLGQRLAEIQPMLESADVGDDLINIIGSLRDESEQLRVLGEEQRDLKKLLTERLRRPRHLADKVSLLKATRRAITELQQQNPKVKKLVGFEPTCDVEVLSNRDIMVTVIQNLIRNALYEIERNEELSNRINVHLGYESKGGSIQNPHNVAILSVITRVGNTIEAARLKQQLENGLRIHTSTKPFGSGVGLDITQLVLVELMGATIQVVGDKYSAGLKVSFKTNLLNAKIIFVDSEGI
ncbi:MAG TPA: ATP-binding protein, partial [Pyrinomonadaceae bacterium]|nr:ATP-binding protein [Pyrinomonadaceae bacterium]